jgi:hypothetical protein
VLKADLAEKESQCKLGQEFIRNMFWEECRGEVEKREGDRGEGRREEREEKRREKSISP